MTSPRQPGINRCTRPVPSPCLYLLRCLGYLTWAGSPGSTWAWSQMYIEGSYYHSKQPCPGDNIYLPRYLGSATGFSRLMFTIQLYTQYRRSGVAMLEGHRDSRIMVSQTFFSNVHALCALLQLQEGEYFNKGSCCATNTAPT